MSYLKWRREIYEPLKKLSVITWIPYFGTKYIFMGVKREGKDMMFMLGYF